MVSIYDDSGNLLLETDAALTEQHTASAEVTRFPVERGTDISDHVRPNPDALRVEGIVSNTPLPTNVAFRGGEAGRATATLFGSPGALFGVSNGAVSGNASGDLGDFTDAMKQGFYAGRAETAYYALLGIEQAGHPVTIATALRNYDTMVLRSLEIPRDAQIGDAVRFTAEFVQIRTVQSQTVPLPKSKKSGKSSTGRQPAKVVEKPPAIPDSALKGTFNPSK